MLFVLLLFVIVCLWKIKYCKEGYSDYLDMEQTKMIKGIFAFIIFICHFNSYVVFESNLFNSIFNKIISYIGQLSVVMFLFYSGYGIFISSKKKENYFDSFWKKRIIKTIVAFDIAICLFLVCNIIGNIKYPTKDILLSFVGWCSIGNSNWFVFVIITLYIITYIIAKIFKNNLENKSLIILSISSIILIIILSAVKESWWYNTILCYPLGMWYGLYKNKIDIKIQKKYFFFALPAIVIFMILFRFRNYSFIVYEIMSCSFCILLTLFTYKVKISNKVLEFLGNYSFEIYILQRLPYIFIMKFLNNNYFIFFIAFLCTCILSILFKKVTQLVNRIIKL